MPQTLVQTVVKVGGGLLADAVHLDAALEAIAAAAATRRLLVVPGGGPFADAVREIDRQVHLSDDDAHWMAVLAMDQYAHLLASRLPGATLVNNRAGIEVALAAPAGAGRPIPVLAPYRWLREADPLRHTWDITSDSIAAWFAGQLRAERLVLIKPAGASGETLVDVHFTRVLPADVAAVIVPADQIETVRDALAR
jgi:aspartokinase-like uncharacterized kinase